MNPAENPPTNPPTNPEQTRGRSRSDDQSARVDAPTAGRGILRATVFGTALFSVLGLAAALRQDDFTSAYVAVSLIEFFVGIIVFVLAFLRAIDRSRTEAIGIGGLFFASGSAPKRVQATLMGSLSIQVIVSIAVASVHLYTALAFGVLAPMWALGFTGLWVAAYGTFPDRAPEPTLAARRDAARRSHRDSAPKKPTNDEE